MTEYKHLNYEELCKHADSLRQHLAEVEAYRDEKSGAHPVLVELNKGFDWPDCDGGWHVEDVKTSLDKHDKYGWALSVEARYEHDDDRGAPHEDECTFVVKDGRLLKVDYRREQDLADANDVEACLKAVAEELDYEGNY